MIHLHESEWVARFSVAREIFAYWSALYAYTKCDVFTGLGGAAIQHQHGGVPNDYIILFSSILQVPFITALPITLRDVADLISDASANRLR